MNLPTTAWNSSREFGGILVSAVASIGCQAGGTPASDA